MKFLIALAFLILISLTYIFPLFCTSDFLFLSFSYEHLPSFNHISFSTCHYSPLVSNLILFSILLWSALWKYKANTPYNEKMVNQHPKVAAPDALTGAVYIIYTANFATTPVSQIKYILIVVLVMVLWEFQLFIITVTWVTTTLIALYLILPLP